MARSALFQPPSPSLEALIERTPSAHTRALAHTARWRSCGVPSLTPRAAAGPAAASCAQGPAAWLRRDVASIVHRMLRAAGASAARGPQRRLCCATAAEMSCPTLSARGMARPVTRGASHIWYVRAGGMCTRRFSHPFSTPDCRVGRRRWAACVLQELPAHIVAMFQTNPPIATAGPGQQQPDLLDEAMQTDREPIR
jgi:hypothetical protein